MDSFDNFQFDSASSYGGVGVLDDTSSVYTAATNDNASTIDLSASSVHTGTAQGRVTFDEDFDAVLDDLKDESAVDLPPHACR